MRRLKHIIHSFFKSYTPERHSQDDGPSLVQKKSRLINAVVQNDVEALKELLDSPKWYNVSDENGDTLLQIAILQNNKEVFHYMLSLDDFPIDVANKMGDTPLETSLIGFAPHLKSDYYAYELLQRGVKVFTFCHSGGTLLNRALMRQFIRVARLLIEKGADVNAVNSHDGYSALHTCLTFYTFDPFEREDDLESLSGNALKEEQDDLESMSGDSLKEEQDDLESLSGDSLKEKQDDLESLSGDSLSEERATPLDHYTNKSNENLVEGVTMLLCYGADPFIPTFDGYLAFDSVLFRKGNNVELAQEMLFYYTFDEYSRTISLPALLQAAKIKCPFFYQLIENISEVNWENCDDLDRDMAILFGIELSYLKTLIEKFSYAFEYIFNNLDGSLFLFVDYNEQFFQNIDLLVNSKFGSAVIESICNMDSSLLIQYHIGDSLDFASEIVCYFLSYGMTIKAEDFQIIYKHFGFCELVKILLHMDVKEYKFAEAEIIPALLYNVEIYNIETYLQDPYKFSTEYGVEELLSYSAHPKLKEFCYELDQESLIEKAKNLPCIPLLMELARDVFRPYFIKKFNITTSRQFYTMLRLLPISEVYKKIITFEAKLYY